MSNKFYPSTPVSGQSLTIDVSQYVDLNHGQFDCLVQLAEMNSAGLYEDTEWTYAVVMSMELALKRVLKSKNPVDLYVVVRRGDLTVQMRRSGVNLTDPLIIPTF